MKVERKNWRVKNKVKPLAHGYFTQGEKLLSLQWLFALLLVNSCAQMSPKEFHLERDSYLDTYLYHEVPKPVRIYCDKVLEIPITKVKAETQIEFSLFDNRDSHLAAQIVPKSGPKIDIPYLPDANPLSSLDAQIKGLAADFGLSLQAKANELELNRKLQVSLIQANARFVKQSAKYGMQGNVELIIRVVDAENIVLWSKRISSDSFFETFSRGTSFSVEKSINDAYCDASNKLRKTWHTLLPYLEKT